MSDAGARSQRIVFSLILITLSTLLALSIGEVALRVTGLGFGHSPFLPDPVFHHVHPKNFRFRLNVPSTNEIADHDIYWDANGEPADPNAPMHIPPSPHYRAAFLGDSFVEGNQVPWPQSFVGQLTRGAGDATYVRNYGVSSYSPIFYRLLWKQRVAQFHPTHVFVLLFSNDISDDEQYGAIARRDAAGNVIAVPGPPNNVFVRALRESYVLRFLEMMRLQITWAIVHRDRRQRIVGAEVERNPEITAETSRTMQELARDVKASGAEMVLMVVPSKYRLYHPHETGPEFSDRWRMWAVQNGVTFLDLVPSFRDAHRRGQTPFWIHDPHYNAKGHALTAEAIRARYPDLFPLSEKSYAIK